MIASYGSINGPEKAHTISTFIAAGKSQNVFYSYDNFSFIQNLDKTDYIIRNIIDDYIDDMKKYSIYIKLSDKERQTYIYNPKLLSYRLYKTTMLYWVILRLNDMCNVHEFDLSKKKLLIMKPDILFDILNKIYNSEKKSLTTYNTTHNNSK